MNNTVTFENIFSIPLKNGLTRPKAVRGSGTKMINMGELFSHSRIKNIEADRVPISKSEANYLLESGDLLFARQSLVLEGAGKCSIFICDNEPVTYEGHIIRARINKDIADPFYYFYYFNSPAGRSQINSIVEQVAAAGVRGSDLAKLTVPYIPLPEQRAIAGILSALDDKIELNRRMNRTLESIGRAVFREWFVESEESHNWQYQTLDQHIEAVKGLSYKGVGLSKDSGIPMHNLNSVYEGGGYKYEGIKFYTGEYRERHLLHAGDIIVTNTEQGFEYLLIGYPAIVPKHFGQIGIFSHHLFRVRPLPGSPVKTHYLYFLLMSPDVREQIIGCTNGTTVNMLSIDGLKTPKFKLPPKAKIDEFERFACPIFEKMELLYEESRTLANLRDTLLPKLMSGEVRVSV